MNNVKSIIVVGGGTAGWMAASYLSVKGYQVTVIESDQVPIVGVGESTLPAINYFCSQLGLKESDWMPQVNAVYKLGINYRGWTKKDSSFWHWFIYDRRRQESQTQYVNTNTLPAQQDLEYGYHVDAIKFGYGIAKPVAFKHGCVHVVDHIETIDSDNSGIVGLVGKSGVRYTADYYVDCTGWTKLLAKAVGISYSPYTHLLNDRAIVCQQEPLDKINNFTITHRKSAGWIFEIALTNRRGVGYVYSSKFITDEQAIEEYCEQYPATDRSRIRRLKFTPEKCLNPLHKNVMAIGLSAGFIEPLEATGLFVVQHAIEGFHKTISTNRNPKIFNRAQQKVMDEIAAYILAHYTLANQNDTAYWRYFQDLERTLETKKTVIKNASGTDVGHWQGTGLFFPYNWWALLNGYDLL
jgi:hypothetical protein